MPCGIMSTAKTLASAAIFGISAASSLSHRRWHAILLRMHSKKKVLVYCTYRQPWDRNGRVWHAMRLSTAKTLIVPSKKHKVVLYKAFGILYSYRGYTNSTNLYGCRLCISDARRIRDLDKSITSFYPGRLTTAPTRLEFV